MRFAVSDLDLHCMPMVLWGTLANVFSMSDLDLHCMPLVLCGILGNVLWDV